MSTVFRSDTRSQLQDGLSAVIGLEQLSIKPAWKDIFPEEGSDKAYEEEVMMKGTEAAAVKGEGAGIMYSNMRETYKSRYTHSTIALGLRFTEEAIEDNLYISLGAEGARAMMASMNYTKEVRRSNVLNNAYDTNFPGGDGRPLLDTAHPLGNGSTLSNTLATPAQLSESAMEEMSIQIAKWTDEAGIPREWMVKRLVVPEELKYVAMRLLKSNFQPDTDLNNINALKEAGDIPMWSTNRYLTDTTNWFFITNCRNGLKAFSRVALTKKLEGAFETGDLRLKLRERYSEGWTNPRGIAGSG